MLLLLTGVGLWRQHLYDTDGFTILILVQGGFYVAAVALTWRGGLSRRALAAVLVVAALMRLAVLLAPPYLSDDINRYVWDGRVEGAGINPYRYVPVDPHLAPLRDQTIFPNINRSGYAPTIYPPVAEYIFFLGTRLGQSLTAMKATMLAFELAGVLLLLRLLDDWRLPRERILIYVWHPLTLWEFAGSGHVDAAVVTLVVLALWARRRQAAWLTGSALAAAALVKFLPVVLFPALYRRWDWKMPVAAAATVVIAYAPFIGAGSAVLGFLPGYLQEEGLQSGAGFFLWNLLSSVAPLEQLGSAAYLALAAAVLLALAVSSLFTAERRYLASALTLAVATMVLLSPHYPWYFAWIVPLLCFTPRPSALYLTLACPLLYFAP
ncbi:MAG: glycosyltransferase 87 family protein, partial [Betaproteobacteria bacterium]|nr:glycosyltransferase 87 family protein [Betaproteobacteria bacterium]